MIANLIERYQDYENSMDIIGPETSDWGPPLDCCWVLVSRSTSKVKDRCLIDGHCHVRKAVVFVLIVLLFLFV